MLNGPKENILMVGPTGAGKTAQIWTLPGKKFVYVFDPNSRRTLEGLDYEYAEFLPDTLEIDATIKAFNRDAKKEGRGDKPSSDIEPVKYMEWVEDINKRVADKFFDNFSWLIFDSMTFLVRTVMDRQLWVNRRYGEVEDLADYRIVGSKLSDVFRPIAALPLNLYCTGHISEFQDEKTKRITTELMLPGSGKVRIPLVMTNIWEAIGVSTEKEMKYQIKTRPADRGLKCIRSSIRGLSMYEDVTIPDACFDPNVKSQKPEDHGIGKLLGRG